MSEWEDKVKKIVSALVIQKGEVDQFEAVAWRLRKPVPDNVFRIRQAFAALQEYEAKNRTLLTKIGEGEQEPSTLSYVPDLNEECRALENLGTGLGPEESLRIFRSLCRLNVKRNTKHIRLWGKILCTGKDYYIAQGAADGGEEIELPLDAEPRGTGANKNNYWATTQLTAEWTELPLVTPTQIKVANKIKYIFTGNLQAAVLSNPAFTGKQSHLLRCQIVRITASCTIVPRGSFVLNAQNPAQVDVPQQYTPLDLFQLTKMENWVYASPSLRKCGRFTLIKPEGLEQEEEEKWNKQMILNDPAEIRLKSIAMDSEKWAVRCVGMDESSVSHGKISKSVRRGVVGIKSLVWPGWVTAAFSSKQCSFYVGYAHKFKTSYFPFDPELVLTEANERKQFIPKDPE